MFPFFFGTEKKVGHSFDVKTSDLSIYGVFRMIQTLLDGFCAFRTGVLEDKIHQMMNQTPDLRLAANKVTPASEPCGQHSGDLRAKPSQSFWIKSF